MELSNIFMREVVSLIYKLLVYFSPLLLLFGCSNEVNGIDKSIYDKSEKYANILVNYDDGIGMQNIDDIYEFLNEDSYTEKEQDLVNNISKLFNLNARVMAQKGIGESTEETDAEIEKTVKYLENEYQLNIEYD